uniref:Uncharacterized protein n=1 Tax=Rhizophora mucronata TaxID=61149 RepID=A0A2P2LHM3_RHIMU
MEKGLEGVRFAEWESS